MKERLLYPCFYEEQINVNGEVVWADQIFQLELIKFLRGTDFPKDVLDEKERYSAMQATCNFRAYNTASNKFA